MNTKGSEYQALADHYQNIREQHMRTWFADDPARFHKFCVRAAGLTLDYSKNRITELTMTKLMALARSVGLSESIKRFFAGEKLNVTEQRAAMHIALRHPGPGANIDANIIAQVHQTLERMEEFTNRVTVGQQISQVVNLGIGGSDLGPSLVTEALTPYDQGRFGCHFVANVDGSHIADVLAKVDPCKTLFIVTTKSFRTQETLYNAQTAKEWLINHLGEGAVAEHFVAVTAQTQQAIAFGIKESNIFPIWDWVGGRFSVWSAVGLPIMMAIGPKNFREFLSGAHEMDQHFALSELEHNLPVIMALLSIWYINFFGSLNKAVIPYDYYLGRLPAYLQQGLMESNGKRVNLAGEIIDYHTAPVIFGTTGSNGQHAFHQLLHQGTPLVPVDFIVAMKSHNPLRAHHEHLVANCLSQSQALMMGNDEADHKAIPGNKPSNTIIYELLTPSTLGALLALYEHKIFVQGALWGINSFDQWGVELGKQMADDIVGDFQSAKIKANHDCSTQGLMREYYKALGITDERF